MLPFETLTGEEVCGIRHLSEVLSAALDNRLGTKSRW